MTSEAEEFLPTWDLPGDLPRVCPLCHAARTNGQMFCPDCGFVFPESAPTELIPPLPPPQLRERYEVGALLAERGGTERYRGTDTASGRAVILVRAPHTSPAKPASAADVSNQETSPATAEFIPPLWPSLAWERQVVQHANHPSLPAILDHFTDGDWEYVVEELPEGQFLWDAWDDPEATNELRFYWLKQIAEALQQLHRAGALPEALRPDQVHVTAAGQARLTSLADLLPLPLPTGTPVRGSLYTAPELVLADERADARANLYTFGAMVYSLIVGRELTESDFERDGVPKPFVTVFPEAHPLVGRLLSKTFCRPIAARFPTDEEANEDPTGFGELIRVLDVCRRTLDQVRLDVAAWTTTGMVRAGNEDAFYVLHATAGREDDLEDAALVLLADGMGGAEAGEVAARLAVQTLRAFFLRKKTFAALLGRASAAAFDRQTCARIITAGLKRANRIMLAASKRRNQPGMGCTAEVVFVRGRDLIVGHVGDSRTYLYQDGRLVQITRDQTLVERMVELGSLSAEEAETHPQRSELLQAIGGRNDLEPALYQRRLKPGAWVLVCSDGLANHLQAQDIRHVFQNEAASADAAARRLVNYANLSGGVDNTTVVVIRSG